MRRHALILASASLIALVAAGCSSTEPSEESADAAGSDGFAATVETAFGEVTIDEEPERIVALGWGDAETVLALGGEPVGASDWLDFGGDGVGPWAEGMYEESPTIIETLEPDYEAIAALEPDLILDVKSSGEQERYERLSSIAPTVGVPEGGENYLTTPEQQLDMIATAMGVPDKADELEADIDEAFNEAVAEHPEWEGLTATAATRTSEGWGAYIAEGTRMQFLQRLGFVPSPAITEIETSASGFSVDISSEQLDLLDADLLVAFPIYIDAAEITDDPQWQAIRAVEDGRAIVMEGAISSAYALGSTLSTKYAIESLVPLIEDALG